MEDQELANRVPAGIDLSSILNAFVPSAEAAPKKPLLKKPLPLSTPAPELAPQMDPFFQEALQKAKQASASLQTGGANEAIKNAVHGETKNNETKTTATTLSPETIEQSANAFRSMPEWQRQEKGLQDIEHLIALDAQRKAGKAHLDLSPLGAYLDAQNARYGQHTGYAEGLKGTPEEGISIKDLDEVQRRRADMARELINAVKASKAGQIVDQYGNVIGFSGGEQPVRGFNPVGNAKLKMQDVTELKHETDKAYKANDEKMEALNNAIARVKSNGPAEIGSLSTLFERMDTGSVRVIAGVLGMEKPDQATIPQISQWWSTHVTGRLSEHSQKVLMERLNNSLQRSKDEREAIKKDLYSYGRARGTSPSTVDEVVGSHHKLPEEAYKELNSKPKSKLSDEQIMKMLEGR